MILSEFPILYNYGLPFFASDQWDTFHKNALNDVTGWVTKLWNHPAIMIWVLTNESGTDEFWEMTTLRDHVLSLDPTRPTLRSGEVTKESHDIHTCFNSYTDTEGWLQITIDKVLRNTAPEQTISNSEYMNLFGTRESSKQRWLGDPESEDEKLLYAEFAMEHTEAMRRYDFDLILPYMYAGWPRFRGNNWRKDFPTPMAAALHSSMSPVLASLDLFNRNFKTGQGADTPLYLINDLHRDIMATVKIYLTKENPLFVPDSNILSRALWVQDFQHTFKGDCKEITYISWQVPEQSGKYYISAVVFIPGKHPVTSQRIVRAVEQQRNKNNNKNLCLLGADKQARDWLALHHLNYFEANRDNIKKADIFLIWNAIVIKDNTKTLTRDILEQIQSGSKLVILEQEKWDWKELVDYDVEFFSRSRAFAYKEALNNNILTNTKKEMFMRWNGLPGTVTEQEIKGHLLEKGHKIMWAESPEHCYLLQVPYGRGEMIISQLDMKAHLLYGERDYDPVAEQVMFNLLGLF